MSDSPISTSPPPTPSKSPLEQVHISSVEPPRSRGLHSAHHDGNGGPSNHLSPLSPTVSGLPPDRRLSSTSGLRRRHAPHTVTNPKYVTLIPGSEPGLNPGDSRIDLHTYCGITVVDFSQEKIIQTELDNDSLPQFLEEERPEWSRVRWINLNGLSWDCISAVAKKYKLHRLALEDLLNTKNRTKCDWYSDHAFVNLAMIKLVHSQISPSQSQETLVESKPSVLRRLFRRRKSADHAVLPVSTASNGNSGYAVHRFHANYKSLQQYYGTSNTERVVFMERHTTLAKKNMMVSVEQVSIFMTSCNTVISFFENSADDVEPPILERLGSEHTVLRSSCDASMMLQAIVDAIIDLAFPVIHAYQDTMSDLEVNVITDPDIQHTTALYILTSELSLLKQTIAPVVGLINSLRGHKLGENQELTNSKVYGVQISEMAKTYLADVEDHCVMMMERLDTMKRGADNMIELIFNTIGALQNESMKKLTVATILFLPLTFLTGYFGMNFDRMDSVQLHSEAYYWKIAVPLGVVTAFWLLGRPLIREYTVRSSKRDIRHLEQKRVKLEAKFPLQRRETFRDG
ncbi:hypothetical protein BDZ91DRAFT_712716 [Kalaharituber pfeilii]|nr:hypothetical protein BDZ91DRAFT_712716 [Kalaharituber pfeilii]